MFVHKDCLLIASFVLAWLLPAIARAQATIAETADQAWEARQQLRHQLFEQIPESPVSEDDSIAYEMPVERFKRGFFQRAAFAVTSVGYGTDDLEVTSLETSLGVAVPLGSFQNLLAITPSFRVDDLHGPLTPDVPEQLYETGINFFWRKELNERWGVLSMVAPTIRSDFEVADPSLRWFGLGLITWEWMPEVLQLSFGAVYLDRSDVALLPAVGLKWTPTPEWQVDLMFPRPRAAYRWSKSGADSETWVYLSGNLGGNTWDVRRADNTTDQLSLRDYRLAWGVERITAGGGGWFAEAGYVFGRQLEYEVTPLEVSFSDALLLRAGFAF